MGVAAAGGTARAQDAGPVIPAAPATPGPFGLTPGTFTTAPGAYGAPAAPVAIPSATPGAAAAGIEIPTVPPPWLFTPALTVGETFDDNVNLAPAGSHVWDFITSVSPEIDVAGNTGKTTLAVVYDPQVLIYARSSPSSVLQQRFLGTGTTTLWPETLFFDASAQIAQAFVHPTGPIGASTITTSNNLTTTYATNASPYLREHLGTWSDSESRYRFSTASTSAKGIADEQIHEVRETLLSGEAFGRLGWQLTGDFTRLNRAHDPTDPLGGISSKDELGRSDFTYPVYANISLVGGVGWERISDPTFSPQPKGVIWDAGLSYQPNTLVAATLTYGERFDTTDIEFNGTYNLDPALRLSAIYTQTIQTSLAQIAGNASQTTNQNGTLTAGGQPLSNSSLSGSLGTFGLSSGSFLVKTAEAEAVLTKERDTYSLTLSDTKERTTSAATITSTIGSTPILTGSTALATAERILGGAFAWDHKMWPDLTATAGASYYRTLFLDGTGRHDNTYTLSLAFTYFLSRTATANLSLLRSDLRSNIAINSLVDDQIMATVRKQF